MKALIIFLISFNSYAYFMTEADFESCKVGGEYIFHAQKNNCEKHGQCVEIPNANCEVFEAHDEIVNGEPIYSKKENVTACQTVEECRALNMILCEELEDYEFFYAAVDPENKETTYEAYCTKLTGYKQVKSGRKLLKENATKKAEFLSRIENKRAEQEQKRVEKEARKNELKEVDIEKVKTIAELKVIVQKLIEDMSEE